MQTFIIPKLLKTKRCLCLSDLSLMTDFLTQVKANWNEIISQSWSHSMYIFWYQSHRTIFLGEMNMSIHCSFITLQSSCHCHCSQADIAIKLSLQSSCHCSQIFIVVTVSVKLSQQLRCHSSQAVIVRFYSVKL